MKINVAFEFLSSDVLHISRSVLFLLLDILLFLSSFCLKLSAVSKFCTFWFQFFVYLFYKAISCAKELQILSAREESREIFHCAINVFVPQAKEAHHTYQVVLRCFKVRCATDHLWRDSRVTIPL